MGDVNFNTTFNFNVNLFQSTPNGNLSGNIGNGIFADFANPLGAGPFAFATLPMLFALQGGRMQEPQGGGQAQFVPEPQADWTAPENITSVGFWYWVLPCAGSASAHTSSVSASTTDTNWPISCSAWLSSRSSPGCMLCVCWTTGVMSTPKK